MAKKLTSGRFMWEITLDKYGDSSDKAAACFGLVHLDTVPVLKKSPDKHTSNSRVYCITTGKKAYGFKDAIVQDFKVPGGRVVIDYNMPEKRVIVSINKKYVAYLKLEKGWVLVPFVGMYYPNTKVTVRKLPYPEDMSKLPSRDDYKKEKMKLAQEKYGEQLANLFAMGL